MSVFIYRCALCGQNFRTVEVNGAYVVLPHTCEEEEVEDEE